VLAVVSAPASMSPSAAEAQPPACVAAYVTDVWNVNRRIFMGTAWFIVTAAHQG
jgi:hypothetical protein